MQSDEPPEKYSVGATLGRPTKNKVFRISGRETDRFSPYGDGFSLKIHGRPRVAPTTFFWCRNAPGFCRAHGVYGSVLVDGLAGQHGHVAVELADDLHGCVHAQHGDTGIHGDDVAVCM